MIMAFQGSLYPSTRLHNQVRGIEEGDHNAKTPQSAKNTDFHQERGRKSPQKAPHPLSLIHSLIPSILQDISTETRQRV